MSDQLHVLGTHIGVTSESITEMNRVIRSQTEQPKQDWGQLRNFLIFPYNFQSNIQNMNIKIISTLDGNFGKTNVKYRKKYKFTTDRYWVYFRSLFPAHLNK